jgi:ribonuclease J
MIHIIQVCEKLNKKIVTEGRSMKNNLDIAKLAGRLKVRDDTFISADEMANYPAERVVVLATGAQGEEFAALMRIATKKHKFISLNERDTIVLSSSVIPGNELSVQKLKDNLYRHGVRIIHYRASDVHSTGHGNTGELVWIREHVKPRFFMPGYGYHSMLRCHAQANIDAGFPKDHIVIPDNGTIIDFIEGKEMKILDVKAPNSLMMVDGLSVGDVQEVVIRDRKTLAQDGMFVIIATVNARTGEIRKSPDIISRGFVYLRESQELLGEARIIVKKAISDSTKGMNPINFDFVRQTIAEDVGRFLLVKTNKRPIVIPVVLGL